MNGQAKQQCEAVAITNNRTVTPGEERRCRDGGELHQCGQVMCWTHATRYNEGRSVKFVDAGQRLARHFQARP